MKPPPPTRRPRTLVRNASKTGVLVAACGLFGVVAAAAAEPERPAPIAPESLNWFSPPGNPGVRGAWIVGGEEAAGLYALRVKVGQGVRIPPHTHPDTRYTTVLRGTLYVGFGRVADDDAMVAVTAGSTYVAPAGQPHYLWAKDGEVEYQEGGHGPTGTVAVASPKTPAPVPAPPPSPRAEPEPRPEEKSEGRSWRTP